MTSEQIKALRSRLGFTQYDLAREIGCRPETVSRWERGISPPTGANLKALKEIERRK